MTSIIFVFALIVRLLFYALNQDFTFWRVSVFGVPFSDAVVWNDLAMNIADGRGMVGIMGGQRPLYSFLLACLYTWFGSSFEIGKLLNVFASSLFIAFVYLIVEKTFNRLIGFFVAVYLALERGQLAFSLTMMTEPTGALFFAVGFYLFLKALESRKDLFFFMSGSFLAFSNLARPLTLFCYVPFSGLIYFILKKQSAGSRAIVHGLLLFAVGCILVLTPWMLRQKAVHGILSISDRSAESFYAATTPELRSWGPELDKEMLRLGLFGLQERYRYQMRKGVENLKEHPLFFLSNISSIFLAYVMDPYDVKELAFTYLIPLFTFYLFFLVPLKQRGKGRKAIMALVGCCTMAFQVLSGPISYGITIAGMALSLIWRKNDAPFVLAGAFIFSGLFLSIGAGPNLISRSLLIVGWIFIAYHLLFYTWLFTLIHHRVFRDQTSLVLGSTLPFSSYLEEKSGPAARVTRRLLKGFGLCIALFFLVTSARIAYLNFLGAHPENAYAALSHAEQQMILKNVMHRIPDAFSERERSEPVDILGNVDPLLLDEGANRKLLIATGEVSPYVYRIPGFLDLRYICKFFFPRAYDRTVMMVKDIGFCVLPNRVPEDYVGKHVVIVGRLDFDPRIIYEGRAVVEVIAVLPWEPEARRGGTPLIASDEVHQVVLRLLKPL